MSDKIMSTEMLTPAYRTLSFTCKSSPPGLDLSDSPPTGRPGGLSYGDIACIEIGTARRFLSPARGAGGRGPGTRDAPRGALGRDLQRSWDGTASLFYRYSPIPQGE